MLLALIIVILQYVDGKPLKSAEEVSCGKEGNLFVFTCSDPERTLRNKVLMAEPLKMSTVRIYLSLSFPFSIFIYIKREGDYITGCREVRMRLFIFHMEVYCTVHREPEIWITTTWTPLAIFPPHKQQSANNKHISQKHIFDFLSLYQDCIFYSLPFVKTFLHLC